MADTPLTVVGAGVVGLAAAARLSKPFPELVALERRERPGSETSSRNSEVIHGGMYYTPGSLKARRLHSAGGEARAFRRGSATAHPAAGARRPHPRHRRDPRQAPRPREGFRDFVVAEESARGLPGFVNLVGLDSHGLTSALAIAEEMEHLLV